MPAHCIPAEYNTVIYPLLKLKEIDGVGVGGVGVGVGVEDFYGVIKPNLLKPNKIVNKVISKLDS